MSLSGPAGETSNLSRNHQSHSKGLDDGEREASVRSQKRTTTPDWSRLDAENTSKGNLLWVDQNDARSMYEVGRQIGKGTFGVVYEGTKLSDKTRVAIKFVSDYPSNSTHGSAAQTHTATGATQV